ncbi:MAG TPA: hypothetical protein VEK80_02890 [Kribbellaceae bacterium]|nr:hypothetical protein [Kribbellaceae bacterium]
MTLTVTDLFADAGVGGTSAAGQSGGLRIVSYGGGVQSTALLVLAAQRRIDFGTFVMANVGADSENPDTLVYLDRYAAPYAVAHGIDLHVVDRVKRDGSIETLYGRLMRPGSRSLPIPVRMSNGAPGTRSCTADFKIKVIGKWLRAHGASADQLATVGLGISLDEIHRANNRRVESYERVVYPLVGLGEDTRLRLRRSDCERVIREAGLPVPPKSSCYFCPFHRPAVWADMARRRPHQFAKACQLEDVLNARRAALGKDPVYLTRFARPLRDAISTDQATLFDPAGAPDAAELDVCESGWCMT